MTKEPITVDWIQKAIKRPGILRQKAKAAGMSLDAFIRKRGHDPVTQRQVNLARALKRHGEYRRLWGVLIYASRRVNPDRFRVKNKDMRRLVGYCCNCGKTLRGWTAVPAPDPFANDVYNDNTPVVQCEDCRAESADGI